MNTSRLRHLLRGLQVDLPCDRPVRAQRVSMGAVRRKGWTEFGDTVQRPQHYLIRINRGLPWIAQEMILLHEYAHCLCWSLDYLFPEREHHALWGQLYSRVWGWYSDEEEAWLLDPENQARILETWGVEDTKVVSGV